MPGLLQGGARQGGREWVGGWVEEQPAPQVGAVSWGKVEVSAAPGDTTVIILCVKSEDASGLS